MRILVFLEMIKFSHTIFALPFALLSAALASERSGGWRWLDLVGIFLCMVFARSAAMGFNRWADRDLDAKNPRTVIRAIPAGLLTANTVLWFVALCAVGFFASTSIFWFSSRNPWPMILAGPVLLFLCGYSYAKRFTSLAHVWL
ncbi:MAG: UbiA family prenyltransferase, partial [Planctomycetota bacterium]